MQWITGSEVKLSKDMAEEQEGQDITCPDTLGMIKRNYFTSFMLVYLQNVYMCFLNRC